MNKIFFFIASIGMIAYQAAQAHTQTTYYCARTDQISITEQSKSYAKYLYTSPDVQIPQGIQPSLIGWGDAFQAVKMKSAVWTDLSLACNYEGLTDNLKTEIMVMVSDPLGDEIRCNFPQGKSFCDSRDPLACPLVCESLKKIHI